jgi:hypothetical protein
MTEIRPTLSLRQDSMRATATPPDSGLRALPVRLRPAGLPQPAMGFMDADIVIHRLEEAGHTLLCLPQTGHTTKLRQTRHEFVREALEAFAPSEGRPTPPVPPAHRITRMDQAFSWIPLIPSDKIVLRRIVGCRCLVSPLTERHLFSWRRLARLLGADHKAIQRWHANGIDMIVASLAADQLAARVWDGLSRPVKTRAL